MFSLLAASKGKMLDKNLASEHYRDRRNLPKVAAEFCFCFFSLFVVFLTVKFYLCAIKTLHVIFMPVFFFSRLCKSVACDP